MDRNDDDDDDFFSKFVVFVAFGRTLRITLLNMASLMLREYVQIPFMARVFVFIIPKIHLTRANCNLFI
jgi:hypothetical protein